MIDMNYIFEDNRKDNMNINKSNLSFNSNWKGRRVDAINRLSKIKGYPCSDNNPYFDQYIKLTTTKAPNLIAFKKELKRKGIK